MSRYTIKIEVDFDDSTIGDTDVVGMLESNTEYSVGSGMLTGDNTVVIDLVHVTVKKVT